MRRCISRTSCLCSAGHWCNALLQQTLEINILYYILSVCHSAFFYFTYVGYFLRDIGFKVMFNSRDCQTGLRFISTSTHHCGKVYDNLALCTICDQ